MNGLVPMADALWRVVVYSLLIGAGLPAVFALGLRLLSPAVSDRRTEVGVVTVAAPSTLSRVLAWCCFGATGAAVVAGVVLLTVGGH